MSESTPEPITGSAARLGHVVARAVNGGGADRRLGLYTIEDDEDGTSYTFDYTDIATEGFRTVRVGERVSFYPANDEGRAAYVVRLELPDPADYYS
ncbi:hypothetical protein OG894_43415 (plasmid) [Streptomyces sp. NBC_01724]|uniref:cold-shock protein n=1 Tax=Streptomyces sp. NBC_01724 TaxID=2975922 RepID=UPI002E35D1FA|nr:hypothetical protein [Streptomyces sp. NBC_01724]